MHRFRPGSLDRGHHFVDNDIRLVGRGRADMHSLVSHFHMQRAAVGVGINRDRRNPHPPGGLDHAAGNFTAIGDQNLLEHQAAPANAKGLPKRDALTALRRVVMRRLVGA